jgi:hypothetical protein
VRLWAEFIWLRRESNGVLSEHGNQLSVSIKGGEFPDRLNDCLFLKKDSAPRSLLIFSDSIFSLASHYTRIYSNGCCDMYE